MSMIEAIISGAVQGLTEFLPISSSGHLVLFQKFFGFGDLGISFNTCLHAGTLAAVIIYLRKEIVSIFRRKDRALILSLLIATVPALFVGFFFSERISGLFVNPSLVSIMLVATALILFTGQLFARRAKELKKSTGRVDSFLIGLAQAFALIPGISRSGITISTAISRGITVEEAFNFSFLMSIPVIAAAAAFDALKIMSGSVTVDQPLNYALGGVTACIVGLFCLPLLKRVVLAGKLYYFAVYCLIVGITGYFLV